MILKSRLFVRCETKKGALGATPYFSTNPGIPLVPAMEVDINTCINHTFRLATLAVSFSVQLYRICILAIGLWALEESHFIRIHLVLSAECRT